MTTRRKRFARLIHSRIEPRQTTPETADSARDFGEAIAAEVTETPETSAVGGEGAGNEDVVLADGIAEVLASIRDAVEVGDESSAAAEAGDGPGTADDVRDGATYRLLGELDRLWRRAA